MKVLILHTDLRVYWKRRIIYLHQFLAQYNIQFYAVELFGKGSPYAFDAYDNKENWWSCLFPENDFSELSKTTISNKIFDKLNEINPDIVIGGSIVFFSGAIGLRWARQHSKKFVMFDDGKPSDIKRNMVVQFVKDTLIKQADALWLPSADYDAEYPYVDADTVIFHGFNCIDNDQFRFENKKTLDHKTIVCVARLVPIKNIENLLQAWKIVEDNGSDYKLNIIGNGPLYNQLDQLSSSLNLKSVTFLGAISNNDLPLHLYNADAFVLPSYSESWGLVVNEAMAAGLPVLLSNKINAAQALLQDGINGYSFNPNNVQDIANSILKFTALDNAAKKQMSDNSLKIINTMDYQHMGQEILTALEKIKSKKNKKTGVIATIFIKLWNGNYNTIGWDKL
ncbi:MAG: glycosyltransferase family 1 protein [Pedobacter sp.]|nr:MAG: glycosyltransferase family 1 protein [Pedobacter sp.]